MWRRPVRLAIGSLAWLIAASLLAATAAAHGGGTPRLSDVAAGPYRLFVWTQPEPWRAGEVHVTVAVALPAESSGSIAAGDRLQQSVTDAVVTVALARPGSEAAIQVAASPQALRSSPTFEADLELSAAGAWQVTVSVAGQDGAGSAHFEVDVLPARTVNWPLLAGGVAALAAIVGVMGIRARRVRPTPPRLPGVRRAAS